MRKAVARERMEMDMDVRCIDVFYVRWDRAGDVMRKWCKGLSIRS